MDDLIPDGTDLTQEVLDDLMDRLLRHWKEYPDGSRDTAPDALRLAHGVLDAWAQEVRDAHAHGDTPRLDAALTAMQRDAGQMITSAAFVAHQHHYSHAGKGKTRSRGQRYSDEDIAERFRKSHVECGKVTAAVADAAQQLGVSERTVYRALERLGVTTAR